MPTKRDVFYKVPSPEATARPNKPLRALIVVTIVASGGTLAALPSHVAHAVVAITGGYVTLTVACFWVIGWLP